MVICSRTNYKGKAYLAIPSWIVLTAGSLIIGSPYNTTIGMLCILALILYIGLEFWRGVLAGICFNKYKIIVIYKSIIFPWRKATLVKIPLDEITSVKYSAFSDKIYIKAKNISIKIQLIAFREKKDELVSFIKLLNRKEKARQA